MAEKTSHLSAPGIHKSVVTQLGLGLLNLMDRDLNLLQVLFCTPCSTVAAPCWYAIMCLDMVFSATFQWV